MGKKEKPLPTISIVTPTYNRHNFLPLLHKCILKQKYPINKIEWIIVDGTINNNENILVIKKLANINKKLKIIYQQLPKTDDVKIGKLRNKTNELVNNDIVICMDDDDFYSSNRIIHAVKKLKYGKKSLAGASKIPVYDFDLNKTIIVGPFGKYHGTNNTFAYTKKYGKTHKYDETVETGEEKSFTNNFKNEMIQLEWSKTLIQFSHYCNTFSKRKIFETCYFINGREKNNTYIYKNFRPIEKIMDVDILNEYKKILLPNERHNKHSDYDIVYYCGGLSIDWSPKEKSLGGSEQAVVELSKNWVKLGYKVAVYGNLENTKYNGVDYFNFSEFKASESYNILILWRSYGFIPLIQYDIKANYIGLDLHDTGSPPNLYEHINKINHIYVKSSYHGEMVVKTNPTEYFDKIVPKIKVLLNGVRLNEFNFDSNIKRNNFRLCYASCYTRGLIYLLKHFYPKLKELQPKAEFHIYYGYPKAKEFNELNKDLKEIIDNDDSIYEHGRVNVDIINQEKQKSNFHLYFTDSPAETDCISIRESLKVGCIPIISNHNVFKERHGLKHNYPTNKVESYHLLAKVISQLMDSPDKCNEIREKLKESPTIVGWKEIAENWIKTINGEVIPEIIPKKIYQTWKTKIEDLPEFLQQNICNITDLNPDYEYSYYDDDMMDTFIKENFSAKVYNAFLKIKPGAYKADFWRYCILYKNGGIYMDIDTIIYNKFDDFIKNKNYVVPVDFNRQSQIKIEGCHNLFNSFIAITKEHPIMLGCIDKIVNYIETNKIPPSKLDFSGPGVLGRITNLYMNNDETSDVRKLSGDIKVGDEIFNFLKFEEKTEYVKDTNDNILFQNKNGNKTFADKYQKACLNHKIVSWLGERAI